MKKPLDVFLLCLVGMTILIAVNRWDVPLTMWLCTIFVVVGVVSGVWFLIDAMMSAGM